MTTSAPAAEYGYEAAAPFYDLFERKNNLDFFGEYAALGAEALDIGAGTGRLPAYARGREAGASLPRCALSVGEGSRKCRERAAALPRERRERKGDLLAARHRIAV